MKQAKVQKRRMRVICLLGAIGLLGPACGPAQTTPARPPSAAEVVRLWPGAAPRTESWTGAEAEVDADLPMGKVHIVTNVTVPTVTVVRPAAEKANGTGMLVVPGGAFRALAWDLDGTETARWLAARGITAFVLKYRVRPPGDQAPSGPESFDAYVRRTEGARAIAVADASQALRLIRNAAGKYRLAPHRLGVIGFSAGGMVAMALATAPSERPDFAVSLYGALPPGSTPAADAPPVFVAAAQDDPQAPPARTVEIWQRWTAAGRAAELHLYGKGGHGFGFRRHGLPADAWPEALEAWLGDRGLLRR